MTASRFLAHLLLALGVALAVLAGAPPAAAQASPDEVVTREILVMLSVPPEHYRPNASYVGDYGKGASRAALRRTAQRIARDNGLELAENWPMPLLGVDCFVMRVPQGQEVAAVVAKLERDERISWAQPLQLYQTHGAAATESDPLYAVQPAAAAWRLADLHRVASGHGVTVAIVDSRIETNHPDLAGQFVASQDFVPARPGAPELHGTAIAGVIGAKADNRMGIAGIAPGASLMALRACWQTGGSDAPTLCDTLSLAKALHYAIDHGVDVINLSLSGPNDRLLGQLLQIALARRISVVAAFDPGLPGGGFPASEPGVIAVADESLPSLPLTVYGAPGRDVPTTLPGGKWYLVNGSSYAAAHVSGLIALAREHGRAGPPRLVAARAGGGLVDACATLVRTAEGCDCTCAVERRVASVKRR